MVTFDALYVFTRLPRDLASRSALAAAATVVAGRRANRGDMSSDHF